MQQQPQYQQYPRQMTHPQHRPAVIAKWDIKEHDPKKQPQGSPERFPPVVVHNFDQEQEYAAKGYVPSGKADPEAYRRSMTGNDPLAGAMMLYPKWLYRKAEKSEGDDVESKLVQTEDEEKALGRGWFGNPDQARNAATVKAMPKAVPGKMVEVPPDGDGRMREALRIAALPEDERAREIAKLMTIPNAKAVVAKTKPGQAKNPEAEAARRQKISESLKRKRAAQPAAQG